MTRRHKSDHSDLPESVAEIADVIGREKALYLIGSLPQAGRRPWRVCFYVPKLSRVGLDHWLVRELGWEDARRLAWAFSGMILQPSNCRHLLRKYRNERLAVLANSGAPIADLARDFELSRSRVAEIIREQNPENN